MKKLISLFGFIVFLGASSFSQSFENFATYASGNYSWTRTTSQIESAFDHYLKEALEEDDYVFDTTFIEDDNPGGTSDLAYWIIKATSTSTGKTAILGVPLKKVPGGSEGSVDLKIGDEDALRVLEEEDDGPWKCTSPPQCGGCIKFKVNGKVAGCNCVVTQQGNCAFETGGGSPINWPGFVGPLIALIIAIWFS